MNCKLQLLNEEDPMVQLILRYTYATGNLVPVPSTSATFHGIVPDSEEKLSPKTNKNDL
jgi:hypothetical protein